MGRIKFKINGVPYTVGCEITSDVTLLDYIRNCLHLKGTKYMCWEGGCGACIVNVKRCPTLSYAVNSCLTPITSCHGWEITTIENVGNRSKGYHALQTTLAEENGTQCGYCSPAFVMSMYSLLQTNPDITMMEIEKSLSSNICRCTGYRPILDAFKKFAKDAPNQIQLADIEDLHICKKTGDTCEKSNCEESDWCFVNKDEVQASSIEIKLKDNRLWVRVTTVEDALKILKREGVNSYMLICGNTAKGVYPIDEYPRVLIDISAVQELKGYTLDQNLIVNAGTTLTEFLAILQKVSEEEYFDYLIKLHDHLQKVAHVAVRNVASIAGNLMIKHQHNLFPSDIFLLLETVGAQVTTQNSSGETTVSMQQFLKTNMRGSFIRNILLPPLRNDIRLCTFKIMPRSLSAHAIVNAGFLYKIRSSDDTVRQARIVFDGLSASFRRATATEKYLLGKKLFIDQTLQAALKIMEQELIVVINLPEPSVEYRKILALGLFYKGLLKLCPQNLLSARYRSGAINLDDSRPVSRATQVFDANTSEWPINQPMPKVEGLIQCAGEAYYSDDIPAFPNEVFCAFALSTIAIGDIVEIDTSKALAYPGVIAVYTAKDIPGVNSFTPMGSILYIANEELMCSGRVKYFNEPIALVVAETRYIADTAAKLVTATYTNTLEPVVDITQTQNDPAKTKIFFAIDATEQGDDIVKTIEGSNVLQSQYHFIMETLTCVTKPSDEGLDVYCSTQWLEAVQVMISRALNMDQCRIDVHNRRVGGGFGIKLSRNIQGAVASALVVHKLNRPCRFIQSLPTNMRAVGKRMPCAFNFKVDVNAAGVIQSLDYNIYEDNGYMLNEMLTAFGIEAYYNTYNKTRWNYKAFDSTTDTPKNTWARAPSTLEHIAMAELVMEQISYEMSLDPLEVRLANLGEYEQLREMVNSVIISSDYMNRRAFVDKFNKNNRWKKRGLRFSLLRWTPFGSINLYITLSVFRMDATVVITHGGIEIGQGINTKAIQAASYMLKIPTDKIVIKAANTNINPNTGMGGGSLASVNVTKGVRQACQHLLDKLQPIREQMDNPTWEELITKAYDSNIDLQGHGFTRSDETYPIPVLGVTLAEVEMDVITGEFQTIRVDICQDAGQSINQNLDIGQVEGAFLMGVGYWTTERLVYAPSGELLTNRTWDYHVPLARDIPQDWRITLQKNSYGAEEFFGAKGIGEPPMCMSVAVAFALREAAVSARLNTGIPSTIFYPQDGPQTVEKNCLISSTRVSDFRFRTK